MTERETSAASAGAHPARQELTPEAFRARAVAIEQEVGKIMVGQRNLIHQVLVALIAGGNVLLEGVPGLGKTVLVRTLAEVIDCQFSRVQFTPDLMPADIIGTNILNEDEHGRRAFEFQRGPVFANLLLADEINRATPKTQSALLEAMQEGTVSVARTIYELPKPFFVLATQNPLEMEGTYPLPEAQLDRFFFKLDVGFPTAAELIAISDRTTSGIEADLGRVARAEDVLDMQHLARQTPIATHVTAYAVRILRATHPNNPEATALIKRYVRYGGSPRALQAMILAGKIMALLDGRYNVAFRDIRTAALPALRHRLILNFDGEAEGISPDDIISALLEETPEEAQ
ncbi:MAG TPA: MoxR family ATPase [Chloroflexia bacterium]|nr:MoxR family ATPase [Chloroflexia bacterium]